MKKVVSFKSLLIGILSLIIIGATTTVFATDSVLETGNEASGNTSTTTEITSSEYDNASVIPTDTNTNTDVNTNTSNGVNTNSVYDTVDEEDEDKMPQTGIEDNYVGVLLIAGVAVSIFTYKKMKEYKNI